MHAAAWFNAQSFHAHNAPATELAPAVGETRTVTERVDRYVPAEDRFVSVRVTRTERWTGTGWAGVQS
jgi:hypothetical protein